MYIKKDNVYKKVLNQYQKVNGVYKRMLNVYVKDNNVYKKVLGSNEDNPKYSLNAIDVLVEANKYISIPVVVNNTENATMIEWYIRIESGNFSLIQVSLNKIEILTDNQSSAGAVWAIVDGVNLGEIPIEIKYSGGL